MRNNNKRVPNARAQAHREIYVIAARAPGLGEGSKGISVALRVQLPARTFSVAVCGAGRTVTPSGEREAMPRARLIDERRGGESPGERAGQ